MIDIAARAGKMAAITVVSVPSSSEPMTVRGSTASSLMSTIMVTWFTSRVQRPMSDLARRMPSPTPPAEPSRPSVIHSSRITLKICRRVAPTARSVPISRTRSITEMDTEL